MSKIIEQAMKIHQEAMSFSDKAQIAQIEGASESESLGFLGRAFELEEKAAMLLRNEKKDLVTRTVLFRGAAVLALGCNKLSEAENLIEIGSSEEAPPQLVGELRDLKRVVDERRTELRKANLLLKQIQDSFTATVTYSVNEGSSQKLRVHLPGQSSKSNNIIDLSIQKMRRFKNMRSTHYQPSPSESDRIYA